MFKCHMCFSGENQSIVKDTRCLAQGNILCLQGTVSNARQSMKFITHKRADNEMKSIHLKPKTRCFHGMLSVWFTYFYQSCYDGRKRVSDCMHVYICVKNNILFNIYKYFLVQFLKKQQLILWDFDTAGFPLCLSQKSSTFFHTIVYIRCSEFTPSFFLKKVTISVPHRDMLPQQKKN